MIALVDCNSFFCSCERLFRPDIKNNPVGVVSGKEGCFVSCCYKLKALGVKVGTPVFKVRDLCQQYDVKVFSSNFALYRNLSDRVMKVLSRFGPEMEIYSVDEAFIDVSHMASSLEELECLAKEIKDAVFKEVGIPVGVGIAPTKTLAKAANHLAKKNPLNEGVKVLYNDEIIDRALRDVPIEDVWGIGRKNSVKMRGIGVHCAYDLRHYGNDKKVLNLFTMPGLEIALELKGKQRFQMNPPSKKKKQIMHSRTEKAPVFDIKGIETLIMHYCALACEKLRKQDSVAGKVSVYIRSSPYGNGVFYSALEEAKLPVATCDTRKIAQAALGALQIAFRPGVPFKKIGVILSDIKDGEHNQGDLFNDFDDTKSERLMDIVDFINKKEGKATLGFGVSRKSTLRAYADKSPGYVSSWEELPKVN